MFGVILVRIFLHSDWIRRDTEYLFVFSPNAGKCGPNRNAFCAEWHSAKFSCEGRWGGGISGSFDGMVNESEKNIWRNEGWEYNTCEMGLWAIDFDRKCTVLSGFGIHLWSALKLPHAFD